MINGVALVTIPEEVLNHSHPLWINCVVGFCIGDTHLISVKSMRQLIEFGHREVATSPIEVQRLIHSDGFNGTPSSNQYATVFWTPPVVGRRG